MPTSNQEEFALEVVRQLRDAGHEALWAGGCVRDRLLGKVPKDFDIATDALPDRVREVFGKQRTIAVGAAFGVITVLGSKRTGHEPIEVATYRSDGSYSDGRRPDTVHYTNAAEDAARRDFTINGLFYDPIAERVIDYVNGEADITAKIVRAIGDAEARFAEDRLRMLRAIRFTATLGFTLDEATAQAVRCHASAISDVSPERIGAELKRMLADPERGRALLLLAEVGLLEQVLPIFSANSIEVAHQRLGRLGIASAPLALAVLLAEIVPSQTRRIARNLKWTNKEKDHVAWLIENQNRLDKAPGRPWSEIQPLLAAAGGADLVEMRCALQGKQDKTDNFCRKKLALPPEELDPPPLVLGADLIAAGLRPGPRFKELLAEARAAQLDGRAKDKTGALQAIGME